MIPYPHLPDGWTSEDLGNSQTLITAPGIGHITVDFYRRGFRLGCVQHGRFASTTSYQGRGWCKRLVADAVAHLEGVRRG